MSSCEKPGREDRTGDDRSEACSKERPETCFIINKRVLKTGKSLRPSWIIIRAYPPQFRRPELLGTLTFKLVLQLYFHSVCPPLLDQRQVEFGLRELWDIVTAKENDFTGGWDRAVGYKLQRKMGEERSKLLKTAADHICIHPQMCHQKLEMNAQCICITSPSLKAASTTYVEASASLPDRDRRKATSGSSDPLARGTHDHASSHDLGPDTGRYVLHLLD
ncbi:hypothetical protein BJ508DRAFT_314214 [Ascobolus immersus RN42]|uniref:Uncharacterized protein n=1 Tax=Ascobolus immersus RN42 TaxID=1160509 RepID=A0A3N4HLP8_ASCIM|nr:hypothetical protein BJ508DRAFT_314214 [Ascobolus immersus RN42]